LNLRTREAETSAPPLTRFRFDGTAPLTGCKSLLLRVGLADVTAVTGVQLHGIRICITRSEPNQAIRTRSEASRIVGEQSQFRSHLF
jgi:hypothetical protein